MRNVFKSSIKTVLVLAGFSTLVGGTRAQADFLFGQTLSISVQDTNRPTSTVGPINFVVNNSAAIGVSTGPIVGFTLAATDNTLTLTYSQSGAFDTATFNGYIFQPVSAGVPAFGSISIDPATTLAGFTASRLSLDSNHFYVNVSGLSASSGSVLKLDVKPVPEPSSLALTGLGLLVLVGSIFRTRRVR